jgi:hypothetical protein
MNRDTASSFTGSTANAQRTTGTSIDQKIYSLAELKAYCDLIWAVHNALLPIQNKSTFGKMLAITHRPSLADNFHILRARLDHLAVS